MAVGHLKIPECTGDVSHPHGGLGGLDIDERRRFHADELRINHQGGAPVPLIHGHSGGCQKELWILVLVEPALYQLPRGRIAATGKPVVVDGIEILHAARRRGTGRFPPLKDILDVLPLRPSSCRIGLDEDVVGAPARRIVPVGATGGLESSCGIAPRQRDPGPGQGPADLLLGSFGHR